MIRCTFIVCPSPASMRLWPGEQFKQMAARVSEVNTSAAVPIIQLSVFRIPRMAAVGQSGYLHSLKNGFEHVITHLKGIVMRVERIILIEIERESVIYSYRSKVSGRTFILKPEDVGKKTRRLFLVVRGHNRMVEFDGHEWSPCVSKVPCSMNVANCRILCSKRDFQSACDAKWAGFTT